MDEPYRSPAPEPGEATLDRSRSYAVCAWCKHFVPASNASRLSYNDPGVYALQPVKDANPDYLTQGSHDRVKIYGVEYYRRAISFRGDACSFGATPHPVTGKLVALPICQEKNLEGGCEDYQPTLLTRLLRRLSPGRVAP